MENRYSKFILEDGDFFPPASAVEGIKSVPSVCPCVRVSVCLSFSALTAEPFDIQTQNLVEALTLNSRMSSKVKVIGQSSRSPGWKNVISEVSAGWITESQFVMTPDVMWRHDVTWRHNTASRRQGMTSWHSLTTFGQEYWQRGHVAGGRVNAPAFSLFRNAASQALFVPTFYWLNEKLALKCRDGIKTEK